MKIKKLKLGKEIVANLSGSDLNQIKGGTSATSCNSCGCNTPSANGSCFCGTDTTNACSAGGHGCPTYFPCY